METCFRRELHKYNMNLVLAHDSIKHFFNVYNLMDQGKVCNVLWLNETKWSAQDHIQTWTRIELKGQKNKELEGIASTVRSSAV